MRGIATLSPSELDGLILDAHARDQRDRLAALYEEAGERTVAAGRTDAACFFWTQAWIFALDAGDGAVADRVERRLTDHDRLGPDVQPGAISSTVGK